jgi:hypothetical protein
MWSSEQTPMVISSPDRHARLLIGTDDSKDGHKRGNFSPTAYFTFAHCTPPHSLRTSPSLVYQHLRSFTSTFARLPAPPRSLRTSPSLVHQQLLAHCALHLRSFTSNFSLTAYFTFARSPATSRLLRTPPSLIHQQLLAHCALHLRSFSNKLSFTARLPPAIATPLSSDVIGAVT